MATTAVQFTDADAAFLMDALHHLTRPLSVNARALASHKGISPGAISVRVTRIKKRYNLEISCEGTTDPNKPPQKRQKRITMGSSSPDSDLPEFEDIVRRAIAAPPTPPGSALRATTVNAEGSPLNRRRGGNAASPCRSKKTNHSPASSKRSEQTSSDDDIPFHRKDSGFVDE